MDDYGRRVVVDEPFSRALSSLMEALVQEGFEIGMSVDVRQIARRLDADSRQYVLLSVYAPILLHRALKVDPDVGVVMPCHIAVYELADGRTVLSVGDPMSPAAYCQAWRAENPDLAAVETALGERHGRVLAAVQHRRPGRAAA